MPVYVRELVTEKFVIDLLGLIDLGENFGNATDFLHQQDPLRGSQLKQLCRVTFEDDDGPAGEKLIVMQIDPRKAQIRDEMVFSRPAALAGFTGGIHRNRLALRHSLDLHVTLTSTSAYFVSSVRSIAEIETFIERCRRRLP
jgi:hypothetical protein